MFHSPKKLVFNYQTRMYQFKLESNASNSSQRGGFEQFPDESCFQTCLL